MTALQWVGLACFAYTAACFAIAGFRPEPLWRLGKIQAFVKLLGDTGARLFIGGVGVVTAGLGVWLTFFSG